MSRLVIFGVVLLHLVLFASINVVRGFVAPSCPFRTRTKPFVVAQTRSSTYSTKRETLAQPRTGPAQFLLDFALASPLWKHLLVPQARRTMVNTAEANGIEWTRHLDWIKSVKGPWQQEEDSNDCFLAQQQQEQNVVVPDYYKNASFHSYEKGNLCWEAALEVEIASRAVGARNFPAYGKHGEDAFRDAFEKSLLEAGARIPERNAVIVDLGCGTGMSTRRLAKRYPSAKKIVGIDLSPYYLEVGNALLREAPKGPENGGPWVTSITSDDRMEYRFADAAHTDFDNNTVDVVNLSFVVHELPVNAAMNVVDESWRILKPGGQLWISEMDFCSPAYAQQRSNALLFSLIRATEPYLDVYADGFDQVKQCIVQKFEHTKITAATGRHYALVATKGKQNSKQKGGILEDLRFKEDGTYQLEDTHLNLWESKREEP